MKLFRSHLSSPYCLDTPERGRRSTPPDRDAVCRSRRAHRGTSASSSARSRGRRSFFAGSVLSGWAGRSLPTRRPSSKSAPSPRSSPESCSLGQSKPEPGSRRPNREPAPGRLDAAGTLCGLSRCGIAQPIRRDCPDSPPICSTSRTGALAGVSRHDPYRDYTEEKFRQALVLVKLNHEPGTRYEYSNFGAGLLGFVLSHHKASDYESLVTDSICQPLGMHETVIAADERTCNRLPSIYRRSSSWAR